MLVNTLSPVSYLGALTDSETTLNPKRPSRVPSHTHLCPVFPHLCTDSLTLHTHTRILAHTYAHTSSHASSRSQKPTTQRERETPPTHSRALREIVEDVSPHPSQRGFHLEVARAPACRLQSRPYRFPKDKAEKLISITKVEKLHFSDS